MKNIVRELKQLYKLNYRNIVMFELIYRMVFVVLYSRISISLINYILGIFGYSYINIKNIGELMMNPLTYPVLIIIIVIAIIFAGFEMNVLYTGFSSAVHGHKLKFITLIWSSVKRTAYMLLPRNISVFAVAGGFFYLCQSFALNRLIGIENRIADIKNGLFDIKLFTTFFIIITVLIIGFIIMNMYAVCYNIFLNSSGKEALLQGRNFFKKKFIRTLPAYAAVTVLYTAVYYIVYAVIMVIMACLVVLFAKDNLEMALIQVIGRYINLILIYFVSIISIILYSGISVYTFYKYESVDDEVFKPVNIKHDSAWNKRILIIVSVIVLIGTAYNAVDVIRNGNLSAHNTFGGITITSHRGFSEEAPENTIPALELAIDSLADFAEIDVRQTKDGEIVLLHDASLYRTTGKNEYVWNMNYADILNLDAGSGFARKYAGTRIPTLKEALQLCKGKINLNIEIKEGRKDSDFVKNIMAAVDEMDMYEQCMFSSTSYKYLKEVKGYNMNVYTGYIVSAAYGDYFDDKNIDFFSVNSSYLTQDNINRAHSYGKGVYAWTVNNNVEMNRMKRIGVDGIITDMPVYAREVLYGSEKTQSLVSYIRMLLY